MLARLRNFFRPPTFDNPEENIRARNLHSILLATLTLSILYLLYAIFVPPRAQVIIAGIAIAAEISLLFLARARRTRLASTLFVSMLWLAIFAEEIIYGGVRDSGFAAFAIVIVMAGLTLGFGSGIFYTALTILGGIGLIYAEALHLLPPPPPGTSVSSLLSYSITLTAVLLLLYLAVNSITLTSRKIMEDEQATRAVNLQLEQSRAELEQRSSTLEQRNRALQAVAEIGSLLGRVREEDEFLQQAARLIGERFGLENVRIFLTDELGEYLLLRAFTREERTKPRLWIARGETAYGSGADYHTYQVGHETIRIILPAAGEGMRINTAFPIQTPSRFIGLINIQSATAEIGAAERSVLQTIADQIAMALENARLAAMLQSRQREIALLTRQTAQEAWKRVEAGAPLGFQYDRIRVLPGSEQYPPEVTKQLLEGKSVTYVTSGQQPASRLITPILLRGQVIGVIGYEEEDPQHVWESDRITVLEAVATQVGMALENTRLIAQAQQRARQEHLIGEVTRRVRETLDMDTILQTAILEMRRSLGLKEAEVRLQPAAGESEPPAS